MWKVLVAEELAQVQSTFDLATQIPDKGEADSQSSYLEAGVAGSKCPAELTQGGR